MQKIYLENCSMKHIVSPSELTHCKNVWTVYLLVLHSLILKKKNVSSLFSLINLRTVLHINLLQIFLLITLGVFVVKNQLSVNSISMISWPFISTSCLSFHPLNSS